MNERFFKVNKNNHVYKEYFEWWNNLDLLKIKWEQFKTMEGIESCYFGISESLVIVPTENDLNKFGRFLCKERLGKNGARKFKKTSLVQKHWEDFAKSNEVKFLRKPTILFDFCIIGKNYSRLFHYNDEVYCSISSEYNIENEIPEGYTEIKGSEFYKIIEEIKKSEEENNGKANH